MSNSTRIKSKHKLVADLEGEMLRLLRTRGGLSRVELARALKLAPSTAGIYVDRLLKEGFLQENSREKAFRGRPPLLLRPAPEAGRFIGVDLEARNLLATVVDFSQRPLRHVHKAIGATDSAGRILFKIDEAIEELIADDRHPVLAIGLGMPGEIDPVTNTGIRYPAIRQWRNVPLGSHLSRKFSVPVFLENNIRSMALAEMWFGAGRGVKHFVCVGVRSGIAAGVVVNGQVMHGAHYQAGEIGHWACPAPAASSSDSRRRGQAGTCPMNMVRLEHVASLSAMLEAAQRAVGDGRRTSLPAVRRRLVIDDLLEAARRGDAWVGSLLRDVARAHGWVVHQLKELFDPEKIIFSGPLTGLGELFLAPVREAARELAGRDLNVEIMNSTLGEYSGAIGAAALALHQWKPKR
jgi:N-acetylglucosamine repressor